MSPLLMIFLIQAAGVLVIVRSLRRRVDRSVRDATAPGRIGVAVRAGLGGVLATFIALSFAVGVAGPAYANTAGGLPVDPAAADSATWSGPPETAASSDAPEAAASSEETEPAVPSGEQPDVPSYDVQPEPGADQPDDATASEPFHPQMEHPSTRHHPPDPPPIAGSEPDDGDDGYEASPPPEGEEPWRDEWRAQCECFDRGGRCTLVMFPEPCPEDGIDTPPGRDDGHSPPGNPDDSQHPPEADLPDLADLVDNFCVKTYSPWCPPEDEPPQDEGHPEAPPEADEPDSDTGYDHCACRERQKHDESVICHLPLLDPPCSERQDTPPGRDDHQSPPGNPDDSQDPPEADLPDLVEDFCVKTYSPWCPPEDSAPEPSWPDEPPQDEGYSSPDGGWGSGWDTCEEIAERSDIPVVCVPREPAIALSTSDAQAR